MEKLGYDRSDLDIIGEDVNLMQGTGNPHAFAKILPGERCLDLGSGLGVDAFLAASRVGNKGKVIGLDLSAKEVVRARSRAEERKVENVVFVQGDMESIPLADQSVDVVISNGGFCLVPDKKKAFKEINRVLVPGGRLSISCTTLKKDLTADMNWPSCMEVFMPLVSVVPTLEEIGFEDVEVDDSNSRMDVWDLEQEEIIARVARDLLPHSEVEGMCSHAKKAAEKRAIVQAQLILDEALGRVEAELEREPEPASLEGAEKSAIEKNPSQYKGVHWGDPAYSHLQYVDMNSLCARVNIYARKPLAARTKATSAARDETNGHAMATAALFGVAAIALAARRPTMAFRFFR
jgi:SAM-dependent methyltransferase